MRLSAPGVPHMQAQQGTSPCRPGSYQPSQSYQPPNSLPNNLYQERVRSPPAQTRQADQGNYSRHVAPPVMGYAPSHGRDDWRQSHTGPEPRLWQAANGSPGARYRSLTPPTSHAGHTSTTPVRHGRMSASPGTLLEPTATPRRAQVQSTEGTPRGLAGHRSNVPVPVHDAKATSTRSPATASRDTKEVEVRHTPRAAREKRTDGQQSRRSSINVEVVATSNYDKENKENTQTNVIQEVQPHLVSKPKSRRKTIDEELGAAQKMDTADRVKMEGLELQVRTAESTIRQKDEEIAQLQKQLEAESKQASEAHAQVEELKLQLAESQTRQKSLEAQLDKRALEADEQQHQFDSEVELLTARLHDAEAAGEARAAELEVLRTCQEPLDEREDTLEEVKKRCERAERECRRLRTAVQETKKQSCELESELRQDRLSSTPGDFCRLAKLHEAELGLAKQSASLVLEKEVLQHNLERCKQALTRYVPEISRSSVTSDLQGIPLVWNASQ